MGPLKVETQFSTELLLLWKQTSLVFNTRYYRGSTFQYQSWSLGLRKLTWVSEPSLIKGSSTVAISLAPVEYPCHTNGVQPD